MPSEPVLPATTESVRDEDWDSRDLSGTTFTGVEFVDVDMTEATGTGVVFEGCVFRGVSLNCTVFVDAAFVNCVFVRSNLFQASFTRSKLVGSRFDRCRFDQLAVTGGDWSFVGLAGADLRGSDLSAVDPLTTEIRGAIITWEQASTIATALGLDVRPE